MIRTMLLAAAVLCVTAIAQGADSTESVEVRLTQKYLVAVCVDGSRVAVDQRRLRLTPGSHTLAFTMRNAPRPGVSGADVAPGYAVVEADLAAGHKYEVEIRADARSYSRRVWATGDWAPVVRDRTAERIVSGKPEWRESECGDSESNGPSN